MSEQGCPFAAGPACPDCDGSCWEPARLEQPQPAPCEGCWYISDAMQECDGSCDGLTAENLDARRRACPRRMADTLADTATPPE